MNAERRTSYAAAILLAVSTGCQRPAGVAPAAPPAAEQAARTVALVKPERKTLRRAVGQPGSIQAFERTAIMAKIPGYVYKWHVDLGDRVRKGDILAELSVPELVAELKLKEEQVRQAEKGLALTEAQILTAHAQVLEADAGLARAEATHLYWKSQSERMNSLVKRDVIATQSQEETLNQYRAAAAGLREVQARIESARALQREKESARDKAALDVRVAEAARQREAELVGYSRLPAPFDGVVTQRSIDTGQFVQPATGAQGDVLYVVERTDTMRIFLAVPETDADWVQLGTPATVRVQALQGPDLKGKVARTAWSLNRTTRTLLTEVDVPNPEGRLRPGMYAYGILETERRDVLTLPASAVVTQGDVNVGYQTFCYTVEQGTVRRTPIEIGARNDQLVEVLKKQVAATQPGGEPRWEAFTGAEEVVQADLSGLKDGQAVTVSRKP